MPIPSTIADLSTTASLNSPQGSESPTEGDNYIRALSSIIRQEHDNFADSISATKGAGLSGYAYSLAYAAGTVGRKLQDWVSLSDFLVTGDLSDETTKVQNAVDYAIATSKKLLIERQVRVSSLDFNGANGLTILQIAPIYGLTTGSYDAIIKLRNSSDVTWDGLWLVGQYNTGYTCAFTAYTDNATQASNITIGLHAITSTKLAFRFSRSTEANALVSEITVHGGFTYGCPNVVEAYGTQTFVSFNGSNLMSNSLGGDAGWQAITQYTVRAFGSQVLISGGEVQHNQTTTGATFTLEPITDATYGNAFGTIICQGAAVESASRLGLMQNTLGVATPLAGSGALSISGCFGYHSQNLFTFVDAIASYTGRIQIKDNNFYCGTPRTLATITCAGNANVYCDDESFGTNFVQGLKGINGGIAHFSRRQILVAANTSSQALAAATPAVLKWQSLANTQDTERFNGNYSTSTGLFTAPHALRSVSVSITLRTAAPTATLDVDIYVGGAYFGSLPRMTGGAGNPGILTGTLEVGDIASGTTIEARATCSSTTTCNFGANERMVISALN